MELDRSSQPATNPPGPSPAASPGPLQFRLLTLLVAVALVSALFGVMRAVGPFSSMVLLLFMGLVAAHVIGNALGTRLRDESTRLAESGDSRREPPPPSGPTPAMLKGSRLTERRRLPRGLFGVAIVGAALGGSAGGFLIMFATSGQVTPAGLALGVGSSCVLGGFAGFMAGSFYTVAGGAWREALGNEPGRRRNGS